MEATSSSNSMVHSLYKEFAQQATKTSGEVYATEIAKLKICGSEAFKSR